MCPNLRLRAKSAASREHRASNHELPAFLFICLFVYAFMGSVAIQSFAIEQFRNFAASFEPRAASFFVYAFIGFQ